MPSSCRVMSLQAAIAEHVHDGDTVALEGFTHLIPFAAGHEIIRQRRRNLTLVRLTPDVIYDQMIAAGCCRKLIFSWAGNPGAGSLHAFRRAIEGRTSEGQSSLEIEEYSHFGLAMRFFAGASGLPFMPLRSFNGSDLPAVNMNIQQITCPFTNEVLHAVPAINPDVAIIHAQRADEEGNVQIWGLTGVQREAAFAARRVIATVEEIVPSSITRSDPNRTVIPGNVTTAVCEVPFGAHPSYVQGYYNRDGDFYSGWDEIAGVDESLQGWLRRWVHDLPDWESYLSLLGSRRLERLKPEPCMSAPVNYGRYE